MAFARRGFILVGTVTAIAACKDQAPVVRYECTCSFLTDTDDDSTQRVEVCESSAERANASAKGCAQSGAPATVHGCACSASENHSPCVAGDCAVRDHR